MPAGPKPKARASKPSTNAKKKPNALPSPIDPQAARDALGRETKAIARLQKDAARNAWRIGRRLTQVEEKDFAQVTIPELRRGAT